MADFDRLFGNLTDEQYEAFMKLSPEDRKKAREALESKKKQAEEAKAAEKLATAKAFHKKSRNYSGDQFNLFPELRGDSADTEIDPLLLTDYRGQTGTAKSLADIPPLDADAGLSETAISRRGPLDMGDYVADSVKSGAVGDTLKYLGLTPGLQSATDKINYANRVIDKEAILKKQAVNNQIELQKEEEAARIAAEIEEPKPRGLSSLPHIIKEQEVEDARRKV